MDIVKNVLDPRINTAIYRMIAILKAADQIVNNSTVLVDDTHFQFAIAANEVWLLEYDLLTVTHTTSDIKFDHDVPALCTGYHGGISTAAATWWSTAIGAGAPVAYGTATTHSLLRVIVINGANAGNCKLQWAQGTTQVFDTKVLQNSVMRRMRLK